MNDNKVCFICSCYGVTTELEEPHMTTWLHHAGGSTFCGRVPVCSACHEQSIYLPREVAESEAEAEAECPVCSR
jgi:hypothetical protein